MLSEKIIELNSEKKLIVEQEVSLLDYIFHTYSKLDYVKSFEDIVTGNNFDMIVSRLLNTVVTEFMKTKMIKTPDDVLHADFSVEYDEHVTTKLEASGGLDIWACLMISENVKGMGILGFKLKKVCETFTLAKLNIINQVLECLIIDEDKTVEWMFEDIVVRTKLEE